MNRRMNVPAPLGAVMIPCDAFFVEQYQAATCDEVGFVRLMSLFNSTFAQTKVVGTHLSLMWARAGVLQ